MKRSVFAFFSMLAFGVLATALLIATMPWLTSRSPGVAAALAGRGLHFESVLAGLAIGLLIGNMARFHWADVPRRVITWFLIRERQFFSYVLIFGCIAILMFY
ncbi:MAG: hypothetical protein ACRCS9_04160 [Hyphomicrobium sp.]